MNKITKWFYERERKKMTQEVDEYGLQIIDEDRFHRHVLKVTKTNIIYSIIFFSLVILVIIKWIRGG